MNEPDQDLRELLSKARRALSPTPADEARVLARTLAAVHVPASPAATSLGLKLAAALTIAGVSGSIGYVIGRQASLEERRAPVVHVTAPAERVVEPVPVPSAPLPAVVEPVHKVARARPLVKQAPVEANVEAPVEVRADPFAELRGDATSPLEIEVRFMKAVERALRDNEPGLALRMLDQLDEEVPQGSLDEERFAASVMARCKLGLGTRAKLMEDFRAHYPASAYDPRVHDSCDRR